MTLGTQEQRRLMVLNQVGSGALSGGEAAALVGLSVRQLRRLQRKYEVEGARALVHGNQGRQPANATSSTIRERVVALATGPYVGFNQQHLTEMMAEHDSLQISRSTVRRILLEAGISSPRRRRRPRSFRRRDRLPREGMLLQIDASRHDWLEGRGPWLSLVGGIDDATGQVPWALFCEQEDAQGYFELMRQTVQRKGVPLAVYSDRHGIFFRTPNRESSLEEQLAGRQRPTQFARLLEELGVQLLLARSPQAKGRVERLWGTFQDRLTSELRLAGTTTLADANLVLARFLPRHNRRFTVPANDPTPAWQPAPARRHYDELFCFKHRRIVGNDHTVQFSGVVIDVPPGGPRRSYAKAEVEVHERFDGSLAVYFQGACLARKVLSTPPDRYRLDHLPKPYAELPPLRPESMLTASAPRLRRRGITSPAPNHPWRDGFSKRQQKRAELPRTDRVPEPLTGQSH